MSTLDCVFTVCETQVMSDNEAICITPYNAHITTHMTIRTRGATLKSREVLVEEVNMPKVEIGTSLADWKIIQSVFKLLKISMNLKPDKGVYQLLGYLDKDLLKLLAKENDELEELTEENLIELIKHIAMKDELKVPKKKTPSDNTGYWRISKQLRS